MKNTLLALLLLVGSVSSYSAAVTIQTGFSTGRQFLAWDESQQRTYAIGAINGMLLAPMFGAPREDENLRWLQSFTAKMSDDQVATIIRKFLQDRPAEWHESLNILTFRAMRTAYDSTRPAPAKDS